LTSKLILPSRDDLVRHVLHSLASYWPIACNELSRLKVRDNQKECRLQIPLSLVSIKLPEWAKDCGVNGAILVPQESVSGSLKISTWRETDWWLAVFLMMECWHERIWERNYGEIHSYSFKLKDWDTRAWDYAWVNRIGLFLRKWFLRENNLKDDFFGKLPQPKLSVSHDVDAVSKTLPIRIKQGAFNLFNAMLLVKKGKFFASLRTLAKACRVLFGLDDWWLFEKLLKLEKEFEVRAIYNFYADQRSKNLKRWLMDPSYEVTSGQIKALLHEIKKAGHDIGLHPSFDSWNNSKLLKDQKLHLENSLGSEVSSCRQHWLRFGWRTTWKAQSVAGLKRDSTLMFNDRFGFRNSSAITWYPWDESSSNAQSVQCTSSVIMDSHFYDYQKMNAAQRSKEINRLTDECKHVGGEAFVLWHPHTLSDDYGWTEGFRTLLQSIK
tara:strand:- start:1779 stop:3092 length:1314 start_codon:yes stop_codon:yes gene_type:complete